MRLIDADNMRFSNGLNEDGIVYVPLGEIESQPTVEAVPVVHARWIHTGVTNIYGGHQHKCSSCGYSLMVSPACDSENYCCNCGARMDGAE